MLSSVWCNSDMVVRELSELPLFKGIKVTSEPARKDIFRWRRESRKTKWWNKWNDPAPNKNLNHFTYFESKLTEDKVKRSEFKLKINKLSKDKFFKNKLVQQKTGEIFYLLFFKLFAFFSILQHVTIVFHVSSRCEFFCFNSTNEKWTFKRSKKLSMFFWIKIFEDICISLSDQIHQL